MGIATIGAVLERKVWVGNPQKLYPNLYVFLVGKAGIGKTRAVDAATTHLRELPKFFLAPTSVSRASLVDCLDESKRQIPRLVQGEAMVEYNSMFVAVDELSALMHQWDTDLVSALTKFYDCNPYAEAKRKDVLRHDLAAPQLNVLCGTTPSNLMCLVPSTAWSQGLMSRVILIHTNTKEPKEFGAGGVRSIVDPDLLHDLRVLMNEYGEITYNADYARLMNEWRDGGMSPTPTHPRLIDYCARREAHLLKLSMIACMDLGHPRMLTAEHFNIARYWLLEAETTMGDIFSLGSSSVDSRAMDDIHDFVKRQGKPIPQYQIIHFARNLVPAHSVKQILELMSLAGMIGKVGEDARGHGLYVANDRALLQ